MSIYNATTKKVMSINARETAPAAATADMYKKDPTKSVYGTNSYCGIKYFYFDQSKVFGITHFIIFVIIFTSLTFD